MYMYVAQMYTLNSGWGELKTPMIAGYASLHVGFLLSVVVLPSIAMNSSVLPSALAHVLQVSKHASVSMPKTLLATIANTVERDIYM